MAGGASDIAQPGSGLTMAWPMVWPMAMIVASFIAYHLAIRALRPDLHPLAFLMGAYIVAFVVTLGLWIAFPNLGPTGLRAGDAVWVVVLGLTLVGIEFGFLMAYRNGWSVSVAPTFSNVTLALIMVPIGLFFLKERLGWQGFVGLGLCVCGLILMSRRPI
jgi:drug/metabolite transporter (DMT)-like permease